MAISNKFGLMVVTTGNKSEMSVGYATLYGDMNGGFNPIKDLYKMEVYRLSRWRNSHVPKGGKGPGGIVIPDSATEKPIKGKVVAVGKGKILENGEVRPLDVKVGDNILFGKYSGTEVKVDGDELLVMREEDVMAVIEK